ncbi:hypothetical protein ABIA31_006565 [Catenulispora sp. MAP5-51]|uniref:hypothetical protein n=1 Tax=Catenulispora sp. MAP5-51 TaxID=3156298 RepID=UPI0035113F71
MSAADLIAVLMARPLTYDWDLTDHPGSDHLGISYLRLTRGAYPVIYAPGRGVPGRRVQNPARRRPRR